MLNLYININGILMVVLIISLVNSGQGGICWLKRKENGKCQNVLTRNITRQECCGSGTGVGFTEKEMSEAEFFFAIAIDDGANCDSCLESCENANCGLNKRCVVRKGRPKCICAPVCKASKVIKFNENYVANKLKSRNVENGNIRRSFHMDITNDGLTKDREAILNGHVENVDNWNLTSNRIVRDNVNVNNRKNKNERINGNQSNSNNNNNNNNNRDQRNNKKKMWKFNRNISTDNTTEISIANAAINNRSTDVTTDSDNPFVTKRKIRNRFMSTDSDNSDTISLVNDISASVLNTKGNLPKSDKMVTISVSNNNNNNYNNSINNISNNNNKIRNNLDNINSQIIARENGARLLKPNSVRHRNRKVHNQQTRSHILLSDISKNNNNNNNLINNNNKNINDTHVLTNETYRYKHRTNSENIENKIRSGFYTDTNDEQKRFNPDESIHNGPYINPVCGTDGKTYKTECQLKKRACRRESTTLSVAYRGHCQSSCRFVKCASGKSCLEDQNFVPHCVSCGKQCSNEHLQRSHPGKLVCGVDGHTYRSFCELKQRACNSGRAIPIAYRGACIDAANCSNINCKNRQTCLTDLATHKPRCVSCGFKCSRKRRPPGKHNTSNGDNGVVKICGTNNHTYYSWCQMMKESCSTGYFIDVKKYGECALDESSVRGNNTVLSNSGTTKPESLLWIDDI